MEMNQFPLCRRLARSGRRCREALTRKLPRCIRRNRKSVFIRRLVPLAFCRLGSFGRDAAVTPMFGGIVLARQGRDIGRVPSQLANAPQNYLCLPGVLLDLS